MHLASAQVRCLLGCSVTKQGKKAATIFETCHEFISFVHLCMIFFYKYKHSCKHFSVCPGPSVAPFGEWTPSEVNVSFGNYGNTDHWYINCSWSPMNGKFSRENSTRESLSVNRKSKVGSLEFSDLLMQI